MKYLGVQKVFPGKFITRYDLAYETEEGDRKIYEMISRNPDIRSYEDVHGTAADSVVLMMHSPDHQKILLNREFRMAAGEWVMNFPAGLIDPGETPDEAARRELREETGLELLTIEDHLLESYSAVGFSNEQNICVIGTCGGTFQKSTSALEEIQAGWYTREEVRRLLQTEHFAARTQSYCYLWSRE